MDPEIIEALTELGSDAIKIIGPAVVAAFATYKAARSQFEVKLVEIEKANELAARQTIFNWLKERQLTLKESYDKLSEGLGQAIGFTSGSKVDDSDEMKVATSVYADMIAFHSRITPIDIDITLKEMGEHGFTETPEYERLRAYREPAEALEQQTEFDIIKRDGFFLLEVYSYLMQCSQIVPDKQMNELFSKYIEP